MSGKIGSLLTLSNWLLKKKIRDLLRKLWNPYVVGRHAFLTQKSRILKERLHFEFSPNGQLTLTCQEGTYICLVTPPVKIFLRPMAWYPKSNKHYSYGLLTEWE